MSERHKLPTIDRIAELLGGDVGSGEVLCPGPNHSATDRSLSVKPDDTADGGFVCYSFANDDPGLCRDHVRARLGLPRFEPKKKGNGKSGGAWKFEREHIYRSAGGEPCLRKRKMLDGDGKKQFPQDHWDGKQWVGGVPKNWPKLLYRLPELLKAPVSNTVYITEGERDCDVLAGPMSFTATTVGGVSSAWPPEMIEHLRDRPVVIFMHADRPGR